MTFWQGFWEWAKASPFLSFFLLLALLHTVRVIIKSVARIFWRAPVVVRQAQRDVADDDDPPSEPAPRAPAQAKEERPRPSLWDRVLDREPDDP